MSKYNYKDDFEMIVLRHDYLKRVGHIDPMWVTEFEDVVKSTSRFMYNKLYVNFSNVGYDEDDLESVANCYMIAYMGNYSLRNNPETLERFIKSHQSRFGTIPTETDINKKEKINMVSFLRQKLQYAATICSRKSRNIIVGANTNVAYAKTETSIPACVEEIIANHSKLGYRKVTKSELKELHKIRKETNAKVLVDKDGFRVLNIQILDEGLSDLDFNQIITDSKKDAYHMSSEDLYIEFEDGVEEIRGKQLFDNMGDKDKKKLLNNFIKKNKNKPYFRDETRTARAMLKNI